MGQVENNYIKSMNIFIKALNNCKKLESMPACDNFSSDLGQYNNNLEEKRKSVDEKLKKIQNEKASFNTFEEKWKNFCDIQNLDKREDIDKTCDELCNAIDSASKADPSLKNLSTSVVNFKSKVKTELDMYIANLNEATKVFKNASTLFELQRDNMDTIKLVSGQETENLLKQSFYGKPQDKLSATFKQELEAKIPSKLVNNEKTDCISLFNEMCNRINKEIKEMTNTLNTVKVIYLPDKDLIKKELQKKDSSKAPTETAINTKFNEIIRDACKTAPKATEIATGAQKLNTNGLIFDSSKYVLVDLQNKIYKSKDINYPDGDDKVAYINGAKNTAMFLKNILSHGRWPKDKAEAKTWTTQKLYISDK